MFEKIFETLHDRPVTEIMVEVAAAFATFKTPIITSEVASGKTMLLPAICAEAIKDMEDNVIHVLMPTRFLANNATDSLWAILGERGPELVGCINTNRSGDDSRVLPTNRIIITTVGYAISSHLIEKAKNVIFDEAHEMSIDLSLAKAIIHRRRRQGEQVRVAIMSATIDATNEADYWSDSEIFTSKGSAYPLKMLHRPAFSVADAVRELITDEGRTGILVFVEGTVEIQDAIDKISVTLSNYGLLGGIDYEIMSIWSGSTGAERRAASAMPTKSIKILVGTNVIESGSSLPWVDGGVSSGNGKVMHSRDGVNNLVVENLPAVRLTQQAGRTCRFQPGVFTLAHPIPIEKRENGQSPEIIRQPLTELVMHCATLGINLDSLEFTKVETPREEDLANALDRLASLGFIRHSGGKVTFTENGEKTKNLPIGYLARAAYCEALRMDKVAQFLPIIALLEVGDIRAKKNQDLPTYTRTGADIVASCKAIYKIMAARFHNTDWRKVSKELNASFKTVEEYDRLLQSLESILNVGSDFSELRKLCDDVNDTADNPFVSDLRQLLFRVNINNLYRVDRFRGEVIIDKESDGRVFITSRLANNTNCFIDPDTVLVSGDVRVITVRNTGSVFPIVENVCTYTLPDLVEYAKVYGIDMFNRWHILKELIKNQLAPPEKSSYQGPSTPLFHDDAPSLGDILRKAMAER